MTKGIPNFSLYNEEAKQMVNTMSSLAQKDGYKVIDIAHLFTVLINNTDDKIPEILQLAGANLEQIQKDTNERLQKILSIQGELSASLTLNTILEHANTIARDLDAEETTIYHILLSLLQSDHPLAKKLAQQGIGYNKIKKLLLDKGHLQTASLGEILKKKFWEDLTELAKAGKLKSVIGREEEFHKMIEILARKERNNVLIL
ncbi:MAG: hypothetical protein LBD11_02590 [Candidatus Peribacteria bacterium]|jgi:ATP-dependent Clp protease ATP-binding subunit ClpB|nr:hypothetical protein [Candidatus Peribacteria bacterium]